MSDAKSSIERLLPLQKVYGNLSQTRINQVKVKLWQTRLVLSKTDPYRHSKKNFLALYVLSRVSSTHCIVSIVTTINTIQYY